MLHRILFLISLFLIINSPLLAKDAEDRWTINDLINNQARPYLIGHRGYGDNLGEDPSRPIENSIASVDRAFSEGVSIVEVDVVMSADKKAVVLHDDYLQDFTCVNSLTYDELKQRLPYVPKLKQVLKLANKYARSTAHISGLVNIEVKTPSPLCDPLDTTEQDLVSAVFDAVQKSKYSEQVMIETFSPKLMLMFSTQSPAIKRNFPMTVLQFLSPEVITQLTGLPVIPIAKSAGFGLNWAEIGFLFRLPGYESINQYVGVTSALAQFATLDKDFVFQLEQTQPGSAMQLIGFLHQLGLLVTVYTVDTEAEWLFLAAIGVDGIYSNNIPLGLALQGE